MGTRDIAMQTTGTRGTLTTMQASMQRETGTAMAGMVAAGTAMAEMVAAGTKMAGMATARTAGMTTGEATDL